MTSEEESFPTLTVTHFCVFFDLPSAHPSSFCAHVSLLRNLLAVPQGPSHDDCCWRLSLGIAVGPPLHFFMCPGLHI